MVKNFNFFDLSIMKQFNNTNRPSVPTHKLTCFGCINIRTAVIAIGLWHLTIHLLGFCLFVSAYYLVSNYCSMSFYGIREPSTAGQISLFQVHTDNPSSESLLLSENGSTIKTWSLMSLFSFCATVLLMCGVSKKISTFILPFLLIQVFDVLFDFFIILTYVLLSSSIEEFFAQLPNPSFQRLLSRRGFQNKRLFATIFILVSFTLKTYLMRIVYLCYEDLSHSKRNKYKGKALLRKALKEGDLD